MANFRTTNKKQLAARVLCTLLLGAYLVGGYGEPVAWGASATKASVNVTEDSSGDASSAWGDSTTASGNASTAFGIYSTADGNYSTAGAIVQRPPKVLLQRSGLLQKPAEYGRRHLEMARKPKG